MWLAEMILFSLVGGTVLGLGLRMWDEWREKVKNRAANKGE